MNRIPLAGVYGSNPLGFLALLGLLRIVPGTKLSFAADGSFQAFLDEFEGDKSDLATLVVNDATKAGDENAPWRFTYTKAATKKKGAQPVADLKPPPADFKNFLADCVQVWVTGNGEAVAYAAAYATDVAVDEKKVNTKPTAFHFTAANQTFLGIVEDIRASLSKDWVEQALFTGHAEKPGSNLRWDPGAQRDWALMANDPTDEGTRVNAPVEWLAFRGLPLLPTFPQGTTIITSGVAGRGNHMSFTWPLWSVPSSLHTVRSALQLDWAGQGKEHLARGVFAICTSSIRRTSQGYGNFGPSSIMR